MWRNIEFYKTSHKGPQVLIAEKAKKLSETE